MKFKMLILIIAAGCSTSPGNSNDSSGSGMIPGSPDSVVSKKFLENINNAGLYQIHQGKPSDTNFVINPNGSFYVT